ncbi:hypothetical protein [Microbacterium sp.]|uniref:hypothetical protein n=1 Tax=Microbacterium sp. TaxID=51671 RepID=UPI003A8EFD16
MTDPTLDDLRDESNWLEWRARAEAVPALVCGDLVTTDQTRAEFIEGSRLLRLDHKVRAGDGGRGPTPVQLLVADVLNAGRFMNAIFEPRRTTKTTSVQAVLLGRCTVRDDYQVGWTMLTTGAKASERFRKDIVAPIERLYPNPKTRPMTVNVGKGTEHLAFPNGSYLNVYTPNGDGFRSGGFDAAFADEGGEADVDLSLDISLAVLPTMDTKIGAQFIVAGTGGRVRAGNLLWDTLQDPAANVLWHGIPETTDPAELEAWEPDEQHPRARMREHIELVHPGVGYTTPLDAVKRNFDKMPREQFLREYGGQFGTEGASDVLIPPAWWERAARDDQPTSPPRDAVAALKVHHNGTCASLALAWEVDDTDLVSAALELDGLVDPARRRVIWLMHWQTGTDQLANTVLTHLRRRPHVPLVYDAFGHTEAIALQLKKARPRPLLIEARRNDIPVSTVKLLQGLEANTVIHYRQPEMDRAAAVAVKRAFGNYGTFRFGPPARDPDADVTPLEAAALALHHLDERAPSSIRPEDAVQF